MGQAAWSPRERADRFGEFVPVLDRLLTEPVVTYEGEFYSAQEVRNIPGCVQRPRIPFAVAATGPRGMQVTARYGQAWVTYGDPRGPGDVPVDECPAVISRQMDKLEIACAEIERDMGDLDRVLLQGSTAERPLDSVDAFVDYAGRYAEVGITEIVIHWPVPDSVYDADPAVFERIATEGLAQLS
jgi:hypothetical protein